MAAPTNPTPQPEEPYDPTTGEVVEYSEAVARSLPVQLGLVRAGSPAQLVKQAAEVASALAGIIQTRELFNQIGGRKHVRVEGWTTCAAMMGCMARELSNEEKGGIYTAVVELVRMSDGMVLTRASAECGEEEPWCDRPFYQRRSMATTRATGKACRLAFSWVMVLAGYEATPSEEMDGVGVEYHGAGESGSGRSRSRQSKADAFLADKPELALAFKVEHPTIQDIAGKLERYGSISEKQINFVMSLAREHGQNQRAVELEEGGATYESEPYATGFDTAAAARASGFQEEPLPNVPFAISPAESVQVHDLVRKSGGAVYRKGDERSGPKHVKLPQELVDELGPGYGTDFAIQSLTREKWDYLVQVLMEYARVASPVGGTGAAGGTDAAGSGAGSTAAQGESRIPPATGSTPGAKAAPQPFVPKPVTPIQPINEDVPF
jgi:hypothetical protein